MACERARVLGFKTKFNGDHAWSANHVLHNVAVSRERSDKRPNELIADSFLSLHDRARNLKHHIFRVVRHNAILVRSCPRVVVLIDKRFDVKSRPECVEAVMDSSFARGILHLAGPHFQKRRPNDHVIDQNHKGGE